MKQTREDLEKGLSQFYGGDENFKHWMGYFYTPGIQYLAFNAECYWLLDLIGSVQKKLYKEQFQVWELNVEKDTTAVIKVIDGNNGHLYSQKIEYTDFPLPYIKLYFSNGILMLPNEY